MDSASGKQKKLSLTEQGLSTVKIHSLKNVIQKHNRDFVECMNVQSLLPYLQEQELLTRHEYEKLTQEVHTKTQSEQNHYLLRILPTKGEHAFERFFTCLTQADEHLGHEQLVKILSQHIH